MVPLTRLQLSTQPRHPLPPTHPLIPAIHDIIVAVKKAAQNPAVLEIAIKTLAKYVTTLVIL